mgnify:CR=1 FL=1
MKVRLPQGVGGGPSNMQAVLKQAQKMQQDLLRMQEEMEAKTYEATAARCAAMKQELIIPGRFFNPDDAENIPTGELRKVDGTPMDFRFPKPIGRDINDDYDALKLQNGYDHNFEAYTDPCAILSDPVSGRTMAVSTDCPGIQLYTGNFLDEHGKNGIYYGKRSGVALETQFYPDSVNHPEWPQPFVKAGEPYHSETRYTFI